MEGSHTTRGQGLRRLIDGDVSTESYPGDLGCALQ